LTRSRPAQEGSSMALAATTSKRRGLPPLRLAVPALIGAWAIAFEIPHFISLVEHDPAATDFRLFFVAAEAGLRWGWPHMYDPARLRELSQGYGPADSAITPVYMYENPPLLAWLVAPLTLLPLRVALYAWTTVNLAAFVAAWRLACPDRGFARVTVLLVSLALWPVVFSLERGQAVLVTYALAIGCWWFAARRRDVLAGVLLALASALRPQDVALLPAALFLCGFRRATAYWAATTVALWATFALVIGATGMGTYLGVLAWATSDPSYTATPLVTPFGPRMTLILSQAAIAAVALAALWRQRATWNVAFAIGLLGTVMSAIHVHEYDYVGIVVAVWLAVGEPTSAIEYVWFAIGAICVQLPLIGMRLPILFWQPIWLAMLAFRPRSNAKVQSSPTIATAQAAATRSP